MHSDTYHVIVSLSVATSGDVDAAAHIGAVEELVEARLQTPTVRISRITVYRGVEQA